MSKLFNKCPIIEEILVGGVAQTLSGEKVKAHSNITLADAEALYETVLRTRPANVLEVGMAFGISSLAILTALSEIGENGKLLSIDPFQSSQWKCCGLASIARAGLKERHTLHEEFDYFALPKLLSSGLKLNFAYIDGWHTFDYALLDWWYLHRMLQLGGVVGFNDCGYPAVHKTIRFVLSHRKYTEIDTGVPTLRRCQENFLRLLTLGIKKVNKRDRYFKKDADWEPGWNFYARF